MRTILPNAYIAFTGTPILKDQKHTFRNLVNQFINIL
ncbi:Type I site-specific restriction-modification system, R (restriction) subunit [Rickettsia canadensis str. CA410]|uniref:Type I site-specific restriction-modification system, R (Restriction) subunit n=1 Tax=Rickettsia canadensis str. CA410 TaxID=1105107 RepID=A0ABN4A921_RICCA|nr:Type I site-specific restriction-modification system, R (restriction) subunit [Rickettsia canadensis str. CA410]